MTFEIIDNVLHLHVDATIYTVDVLHKCFYWYGGVYSVDIQQEPDLMLITLSPKGDIETSKDFPSLIEKIKRDLIDFKLRDIVSKETKTIRELIVAKAFAHYDIEETPSSEISDPVGFVPMGH